MKESLTRIIVEVINIAINISFKFAMEFIAKLMSMYLGGEYTASSDVLYNADRVVQTPPLTIYRKRGKEID